MSDQVESRNTKSKRPRGVHLVGSVPLKDAEEVFCIVSEILGDRLRRIPDGETGKRSYWIAFQYEILADHRHLELDSSMRFRLRTGIIPDELALDRLGYAEAGKSSYGIFSHLKTLGTVPSRCRFQVSLPTPLAPVVVFVALEDQPHVERAYEERMRVELDEICGAIPHEELAIQWDVAAEFALWEGVWPANMRYSKREIIERLVRLGNIVPNKVELGYHLCYGDVMHEHFVQPADAANLVQVANAISAGVKRSIHWIHIPVPRDRADDRYFAPLRELKLHRETELYLGLVHFTDGVEGTIRRIEIARRAIGEFAVATECGFGRRPAETIPALLRIHAEVTDSF